MQSARQMQLTWITGVVRAAGATIPTVTQYANCSDPEARGSGGGGRAKRYQCGLTLWDLVSLLL